LSAAFDAMIDLRVVLDGPSRRTLRIVKARGIGHDLEASPMTIDWQGLHVDPPTEG
jgi:KaiC/GvpD/RAD55 family RecA-like ATPase